MKNLFFFILFCFSASTSVASESKISLNDVVFVSLGSICHPAIAIKDGGYRKVAYPLDWVTSVDGEKVIQLLENQFSQFFDDNFLVIHSCGLLVQSYYHILFAHEGYWSADDIRLKLPELKERYLRRVNRFLDLKNHKGTICFLRRAWLISDEEAGIPFRDKGNVVISDEFSIRLKRAISQCFPDVNFYLFILNTNQESGTARRIDDQIFHVCHEDGIDQFLDAAGFSI